MKKLSSAVVLVLGMACLTGCGDIDNARPESASGVKKATVTVQTDQNGNTVEQKNISERLKMDNAIGSIKHLYVISPYSGQVLIYSTVRGKITSSGKRLTPVTVAASDSQSYGGIPVNIGGVTRYTSEVLQDDGTYGSSSEYIYWWDVRGVYHQHLITGGQIIHVSDQPQSVKSVVINMEMTSASQQ